eukprot:jgi/Ulvmu1/12632/UM093_0025.1
MKNITNNNSFYRKGKLQKVVAKEDQGSLPSIWRARCLESSTSVRINDQGEPGHGNTYKLRKDHLRAGVVPAPLFSLAAPNPSEPSGPSSATRTTVDQARSSPGNKRKRPESVDSAVDGDDGAADPEVAYNDPVPSGVPIRVLVERGVMKFRKKKGQKTKTAAPEVEDSDHSDPSGFERQDDYDSPNPIVSEQHEAAEEADDRGDLLRQFLPGEDVLGSGNGSSTAASGTAARTVQPAVHTNPAKGMAARESTKPTSGSAAGGRKSARLNRAAAPAAVADGQPAPQMTKTLQAVFGDATYAEYANTAGVTLQDPFIQLLNSAADMKEATAGSRAGAGHASLRGDKAKEGLKQIQLEQEAKTTKRDVALKRKRSTLKNVYEEAGDGYELDVSDLLQQVEGTM